MSRTTALSDDRKRTLEVCDGCGFFLDGARNCGYCGEPKCPICGCLCGGGELGQPRDYQTYCSNCGDALSERECLDFENGRCAACQGDEEVNDDAPGN